MHTPVILGHGESSRKRDNAGANSMQDGFWERDHELVKEPKEARSSLYPGGKVSDVNEGRP